MADTIRVEEPGRRVDNDPASIPFAQLAEDCRRLSQLAQLEAWLASVLADRAARR